MNPIQRKIQSILRIVLTVIMIIISVVMTVIILMQEGKNQGLGALAGSSNDTYWGKNRGRSMEGFMVRFTAGLVVVFFVLAILLNMNLF
jgi:preprotein translocase subunit SecG